MRLLRTGPVGNYRVLELLLLLLCSGLCRSSLLGFVTVDGVFQCLARCEFRDLASSNLNRCARLWVLCHTCCTGCDLEGAETDECNVVPLLQLSLDCREDAAYDTVCFSLGKFATVCDGLDEFAFVHVDVSPNVECDVWESDGANIPGRDVICNSKHPVIVDFTGAARERPPLRPHQTRPAPPFKPIKASILPLPEPSRRKLWKLSSQIVQRGSSSMFEGSTPHSNA